MVICKWLKTNSYFGNTKFIMGVKLYIQLIWYDIQV